MNLAFLKDDPLNTVIVNSNDERPLYEVRTPWKIFNRTTVIRRLKLDAVFSAGEIIAEIHWRSLGAATITLYGSTTVRVKDWLRKDGIFSSSRILTASDGSSYKWSHGCNKFTLNNTNTRTQIAYSHRSKSGWCWSTPRRMNIDVSPQGMHFLDVIVVSFVIMEEKARQATNTAAVAAATT